MRQFIFVFVNKLTKKEVKIPATTDAKAIKELKAQVSDPKNYSCKEKIEDE